MGDTDIEYLAKLARVADGALAAIARRSAEGYSRARPGVNQPPGEQFWTGYRQAVEDMAAHKEESNGRA